jgi:hypothetical protein
MKRARLGLSFVLALSFFASSATADDSLTIYGNYYKERSTRVYEPMIKLVKDLPSEVELDATFAVDQITSASGAFTPEDRVISEFREEAIVGLRKQLDEVVRPGINARVSYEPDYTSLRGGLDMELALVKDISTLRVFGQYQRDWIRERNGMLSDDLFTTLLGVSITQVFGKNFIGGASVEARILRGYQENAYRRETHPRERNRYTASAWGSYFIDQTNTAVRGALRLYSDTWSIESYTIDLEASQAIYEDFDLIARFRYYSQTDAEFANAMGTFNTMDPKLFAFNSELYAFGARVPLRVLEAMGAVVAGSRVELTYSFLNQHNFYGSAHILQAGWHIPF